MSDTFLVKISILLLPSNPRAVLMVVMATFEWRDCISQYMERTVGS